MSDIFHSSKYCIERAKHHLSDFERQIAEFFKTNPYCLVVETNPNTSEKIQKVKLVKPLPVALPGIASDLVNNLRSTLDQAVFAISKTKNAFFPIASTLADFQNTVKGRCGGLPPEIANLISGFKPYKGGNNLLFALNALCNTNKHGIIAPTAIYVGEMLQENAYIADGSFSFGFPVWDRAKNEMELCRYSGDVTDIKFKVAYDITVCDIEFVDGQPAIAVFREFIRIVESIIMALEAESKRLGLC